MKQIKKLYKFNKHLPVSAYFVTDHSYGGKAFFKINIKKK